MAHRAAAHKTAQAAKRPAAAVPPKLSLPPSIATPADVGRLARELDSINDSLLQLQLRDSGTNVQMPKTSHLLGQLVEHNKLNLLHAPDRTALQQYLGSAREKAPRLHMSFGVDPSPAFMEKLMTWLRREIHPEVLLSVGLQPSIGAGCILRTPNKYFDLSLQQTFIKQRELLLRELAPPPAPPAAAPAPPAVAPAPTAPTEAAG